MTLTSGQAVSATRLEGWLMQTTRALAREAATQVRAEIGEHYEAAYESAVTGGASADEADRQAVAALGDPTTANCQYRKVMLTSAEAGLLREGNWEARVVCSYRWVKWAMLALPLVALATGTAMLVRGDLSAARILLAGGIATTFLLGAPFLPVYTPGRGRAYRTAKWVIVIGGLVLAFGPHALTWSWLLISSLWPFFWSEYTRESIRRKLPVQRWPKHLYL